MSIYMSAENCTLYQDLQPNSDISGIGVFYSFFVTAYAAFICCVLKLILDHLQNHVKEHSGQSNPNLERWSLALRGAVISFGDQQLLVGISLLVAGFSHLRLGIATYHWESVVNQAWFSTVTHLITLTAMKDELPKSQRLNPLRIVRLICMGILISMLIVALYPMGWVNSPTYYPDSFPAWCYYAKDLDWRRNIAWESPTRENTADDWELIDKTDYNWLYCALSCLLLLYTFLTRVLWLQTDRLRLFKKSKDAIFTRFERRFSELRDKRKDTPFAQVSYLIFTYYYAILVSSVDLYSSTLWEITWLTSALAWGTIRIFIARNGYLYIGDERWFPDTVIEQHNTWGFGQIIPMLLLSLSIISFFETFCAVPLSSPTPSAVSLATLQSPTTAAVPLPSTAPSHPSTHLSLRQALRLLHPFPNKKLIRSSSNNTTPISVLYDYRWYTKLQLLQYLLSLSLIAYALAFFPGSGKVSEISTGDFVSDKGLTLLSDGLFNLIIMLFSATFLLNEDVCQFCISKGLDKRVPLGSLGWAYVWITVVSGLVTLYVFLIFFVLGGY